MNILHVNKFFWVSGGAEQAMLELAGLQRDHGHEVEFFAMQHERNMPSANAEFFVRHIDYRSESRLYNLKNLKRAIEQTVYSRESRARMRDLLGARKVDVAHVHLIEHQISPSVLHAFRDAGVPVIHSCHDHKLACPASRLYIEPKGERCERCVDSGAYYNLILHRCMRGSLPVSALASVAHYLHRWSGIYEKNVAFFCCASEFLASRLVRSGIPADKIRLVRNGIDIRGFETHYQAGDYVLYLGRLSSEKGLETLLDAAARLPRVPFHIAGRGPIEERLHALAAEQGLDNVRFLGFLAGDELRRCIEGAALIVLPSECHENLPMTLLEAGAAHKPVVATRVGGVPEVVHHEQTGLLVPPEDAESLAAAISRLATDPSLCETMGRAARAEVEAVCSAYYPKTQEMYEEALALAK